MKKDDLDLMLSEMGKQPLPAIPGNFNQNVWREIRSRQATQPTSWRVRLEEILDSFLRPSPIAASVALALVVGIAGTLPLDQAHEPPNVSSALSLDAFSMEAHGLNIGIGPGLK